MTALISLTIFIGGFVWGIDRVLGSVESEPPPAKLDPAITEQDSTFQIVTLGDSLTRGIGDSSGRGGYVGLIREELQRNQSLENLQITNLAVSGATSTDLLEQIDERGVLRVISQADMIAMTIGGNDLFRGAGDLEEINEANLDEVKRLFNKNLQEILTTIRAHNATAPIYLFGLYNPFANLDNAEQTSQYVVDWNHQTQLTTLQFNDVVFVSTWDMFQGNLDHLLYTDHFHPNEEGYRMMAERLQILINKRIELVEEGTK